MVIVMNKHRLDAYKKDQKGLALHMVQFTNAVAEGVGIDYPVSTELPIATTLEQFQFTKMSLDQVRERMSERLRVRGVEVSFILAYIFYLFVSYSDF